MIALGAGDALLLLGDAAAAILHLLNEVLFDLVLRTLRLVRELAQLHVVGLPARGIEQPFGLGDLRFLRAFADVGDDATHLIEGADLGGALSLLGRKDGIEMRVEGKEHRGGHRGQKHHPQHGILGDQADALHVGDGNVAAASEVEGDDRDQRQRHAGNRARRRRTAPSRRESPRPGWTPW